MSDISLWSTAAFIAIGFYLFICIVPYYSDDWWYTFIHESDRSYPTQRISSFHDIFVSQINHYQTVNGRLPVTTLVQFVVSFCPKWLFNIINSIIFTLVTFLTVRYISPSAITAKRVWVVAIALFMLLPGHYETMMWATGAINYLWVATFILATLLLWRRLQHNSIHRLWYFPIFFVGILAGWSNEALSFGLVAGVVVELYAQRKHRISVGQWLLATGIIVGAGMILIAPGSWNRLDSNTFSSNIKLYTPIVGAMLVPTALAVALLYSYKTDKAQVRLFVAQYRMWLTASIVLIPICLATYQYATRSFFGVSFYSLIPLLAWLHMKHSQKRLLTPCFEKIAYMAVAVWAIAIYIQHIHNEKAHRDIIDLYAQSSDGVIAYDPPQRAWYARPYTLNLYNEYRKGWTARHMEAYYQHSPLQWLSTSLYEALTHPDVLFSPTNRVSGNTQLYTTEALDVYILHPSSKKPASLLYSYEPVSFRDDVPLHSKALRLITPDKYPTSEIQPAYYGSYDLGSWGHFYYIKKSRYRNVTAINTP